MAFNFSIQDINFDVNFNKSENRSYNSLQTYGKSRSSDLLTYPIDLGTTDKAHYMMFTIFEQEVTNFKGTGGTPSGEQWMMSQGQRDVDTLLSQGVNPNFGGTIKSLTNVFVLSID